MPTPQKQKLLSTRTQDLIQAIKTYGVKYRTGKSLCVETPDGPWVILAEDLENIVEEHDAWMASSAGYGSDAVEWKIRAQAAEEKLREISNR